MSITSNRFLKPSTHAAILAAGVLLTACAPRYSAPVQVQASNPTVTYEYRNDQELLQANQNAAGFCNQYQSVPRTVRFGEGHNGRVVVYECVQALAAAPMPAPQYSANVVSYDGYYDDYYGPFYDGYWGSDGFFYYTDGPGHPFRRDEGRHFSHDLGVGFHPVHGLGGARLR